MFGTIAKMLQDRRTILSNLVDDEKGVSQIATPIRVSKSYSLTVRSISRRQSAPRFLDIRTRIRQWKIIAGT